MGNICDAKIHWEMFGMEEGRDANCYGDEEVDM